jgi:hypothetical protein
MPNGRTLKALQVTPVTLVVTSYVQLVAFSGLSRPLCNPEY